MQHRSRPSFCGRTFSDFEVREELGAGGMGTVYRAVDHKLGRTVALKFVNVEDADGRLLLEARAAAALDHPNVGTIYGVEKGPDGELCIVMAFYEGETLASRIQRGPLPLDEAVHIAKQIAGALTAAHAKGIIHRDVKPANVFLTSSGVVKVLDFGLAQITDSDRTVTKSGTLAGTAAYMSPEQVRAAPVDARSDVWSLGAVTYEMLTGRPPFHAPDTYALLYAVVNEAPQPLHIGLPAVETAVLRALEKDPTGRSESACAFAAGLSAAADQSADKAATEHKRPRRWRRAAVAAAIILSLAAAVAAFVPAVRVRIAAAIAGKPERITVAILPFTSAAGGTTAVVADGLAGSLSARIAQLEEFKDALTIVPTSEVIAKNVANAGDAKGRLQATVTVSGVLSRAAGNGLRLDMQVVDDHRRDPVAIRLEEANGDVRSLEDRAASELSSLLDIRADAARSTQARGMANPHAYEAYLRGMSYMRRWDKPGNLDQALTAFGEATRLDRRFARAYVGLAEASRTKFLMDKDRASFEHAMNYVQQAIAVDSTLADARVELGRLYYESAQRDQAVSEFQRALKLQPRNIAALSSMARAYEDLNRLQEAEAAYRSAVALNPYTWSSHNVLANFYFRQRRFSDAEGQFRRVLELTPDNASVYSNLGVALMRQKKVSEAKEMFGRSIAIAPRYAAHVNLGNLYALERSYHHAAAEYDKALRLNGNDFRVWGSKAQALRLGRAPGVEEPYRRAIALGEEALRLNAKQPRTLSLLGLYYACLGDRRSATARLEAAVALAESDAEAMSDIATGYEILGERSKSAMWAQRALDHGARWDEFTKDPDLHKLASSGLVHAPK